MLVPNLSRLGPQWVKKKYGEVKKEVVDKVNEVKDRVEQKLDEVKKKVEQKVDEVKDKVKKAACDSSLGQVLCPIIRDASNCYFNRKKSLGEATDAVKNAASVRNAIGVCRAWLNRSVAAAGAAVKEAACKTTLGKAICSVIADAASCYKQIQSTVSSAPQNIKAAFNALSQWKAGIGVTPGGAS